MTRESGFTSFGSFQSVNMRNGGEKKKKRKEYRARFIGNGEFVIKSGCNESYLLNE